MYPPELEIKDTTESNTSAAYLDLLLSIDRYGQLCTSLYDNGYDLNFHITNFPFLSSNIPSSPAYVFISQLIRYARACSCYECFILRAMRLFNKLLWQGYVKERLESSQEVLWSVRGSYQTIWGPPLPNVTWHSRWWPHTVTPSLEKTLHQFMIVTDLDLITEFDFLPNCARCPWNICNGCCMPTKDAYSSGHLVLSLGLACVLMSRPISPELVLCLDVWISNIPRYSLLLSAIIQS